MPAREPGKNAGRPHPSAKMERMFRCALPLIPSLLLAPLALGPGELARAQEVPPCPDGGTALRWESFAAPLLQAACSECHDWAYADVYRERVYIFEQVTGGNMPPFEPLPHGDIVRLEEWIACGAPRDGPACPPTGSRRDYAGFAREFLDLHCGGCHSSTLEGEARQGAPEGQDFDLPASLRAHAGLIQSSLLRQDMPPAAPAPADDVEAMVEWIACGLPGLPDPPAFRRGDANGDGALDVSDAVEVLGFLFSGTATLGCLDAADMNASGVLDVTDAVYWLGFLFLGGPPPPAPFTGCGQAEKLGCGSYSGC